MVNLPETNRGGGRVHFYFCWWLCRRWLAWLNAYMAFQSQFYHNARRSSVTFSGALIALSSRGEYWWGIPSHCVNFLSARTGPGRKEETSCHNVVCLNVLLLLI